MRFKKGYKKDMETFTLSEDFKENLCLLMNIEADKKDNASGTTIKYTDPNETDADTIIYNEEKGRIIMIKKIIAAAAAVVLVFGGSISVFSLKNNDNMPDHDNVITKEPAKTLTGTETNKSSDQTSLKSETKKTTYVSEGTAQSNPVTTVPVTTKTQANVTQKDVPQEHVPAAASQKETSLNAPFDTSDNLINFVNNKAAEHSPLSIGYQGAGYDKLYDQFYNVAFTDKGYTCTIKNSKILEHCQLLNYPVYNKNVFTVEESTKKSLSNEELANFKRIFDQIDKKVGKDNYFIYDIYQSDISMDYNVCQGPRHITTDTNGRTNYHVEIVLKDYYDKYMQSNYRKDDFIVSFEICNNHTITVSNPGYPDEETNESTQDSVLISNYSLFKKSHELFESFYNEFNNLYSDCAVCLGKSEYYDLTEKIDAPITTWVKDTANTDEWYSYQTNPNFVEALPENSSDDLDSFFMFNISLYFKPGTDPARIYSNIQGMTFILEEYHINLITADVLSNESDFNRFKESNGFIPDKLINNYVSGSDYNTRFFSKDIYSGQLQDCWPGK